MGFFNRLSKKCIFCGSRAGERKYVPCYGIYGEMSGMSGNWYHEGCLREIVCEPERFKSRTVDLAVDMVDRIKETKRRKDMETARRKKQCEYLKKQLRIKFINL